MSRRSGQDTPPPVARNWPPRARKIIPSASDIARTGSSMSHIASTMVAAPGPGSTIKPRANSAPTSACSRLAAGKPADRSKPSMGISNLPTLRSRKWGLLAKHTDTPSTNISADADSPLLHMACVSAIHSTDSCPVATLLDRAQAADSTLSAPRCPGDRETGVCTSSLAPPCDDSLPKRGYSKPGDSLPKSSSSNEHRGALSFAMKGDTTATTAPSCIRGICKATIASAALTSWLSVMWPAAARRHKSCIAECP
mmetsp:Transcript_84992/g.259551  ORF Transcript_84992/g.259551 Transcript_84992/m.259551 type:complete len:254 (+) Transcript_84992:540-1301(+)